MKKYDWITFACDQIAQAHAVYVSKAALRRLRGLGSLGICASWHERVYSTNSARTFVQECIQTASRLSEQNHEFSNLECARLMDILFWATELAQRFRRRSPESGSTAYSYDTLNRLTSLAPPSVFGSGSFGFSYGALPRRTQMTRPNIVTTNYT